MAHDRTERHANGNHAARFQKLFGKGRVLGGVLVNNVRFDFFGNVELGSDFRIGHRRAHLVLANQPFAKRPADHESGHHTERGCGYCHHRAARNAVELFKVGTKRSRCAQTTHHRNGTGKQAIVEINAQELCHRYAEHVLQNGQYGHGNQKAQQKLAALPDQLKAGHHADRREEGKHQHRLQSGVKHHAHNAAAFQYGEHKRKRHAAHHWAWHRQTLQHGDDVLEPHAEVISADRKRQGLHHINMYHKHVRCIYRQLTVPFFFVFLILLSRLCFVAAGSGFTRGKKCPGEPGQKRLCSRKADLANTSKQFIQETFHQYKPG